MRCKTRKNVRILNLVIIPVKHGKGREREKEGQAPMISLALGIPSIKEELLFESKESKTVQNKLYMWPPIHKIYLFICIINKQKRR